MKILIAGSRNFKQLDKVRNYIELQKFLWKSMSKLIIVSGGAYGVDREAEYFAKVQELETEIFYPEWDKYGKMAGPLRNEKMVQIADKVVCFWDGTSRGTKSTIDFALKYKKHLEVIFDET